MATAAAVAIPTMRARHTHTDSAAGRLTASAKTPDAASPVTNGMANATTRTSVAATGRARQRAVSMIIGGEERDTM